MAIGPAHGQHAEAFLECAGRMILEPRQHLNGFAPVALKHGIVEDERGCTRYRGQGFHSHDRFAAKQQ